MRRSAKLSLEGFDPDIIEAAREVAQRAGVPLETWIASVVEGDPDPAAKAAIAASKAPAKSAAIAEPAAETKIVAEAKPPAPAPAPAEPAPVAPAPVSTVVPEAATLAELKRRLDALQPQITPEPAAAAPEPQPAESLAQRLGEIERRMSEMRAEMTNARPLGRRGRPLADEMREAVQHVRARQRELDAQTSEPAPAPAQPSEIGIPSGTISDLQRETGHLRQSLGQLATGSDVRALEDSMRSLATDLLQAREPSAFIAPAEQMRAEVERLAAQVAEDLHTRLAGEFERLSVKAEGTLRSSGSKTGDRGALTELRAELEEVRRMIAALAGPERMQSLAQGMQAISVQLAALQREAAEPTKDVAALRPLLEEIRSGITTPENVASINAQLRSLAEKVDRVGSGSGNLDSLESQVLALADRLDRRAGDPSVAGLEQTMGDLLTQMVALRDESSIEAAVERATRKAIAQAVSGEGATFGAEGGRSLRADLDELRARQTSADERMQATMEGLNGVLSRLVDRLGAGDALSALDPQAHLAEARSLDAQLLASTALRVTPGERSAEMPVPERAGRRVEAGRNEGYGGPVGEDLLEPGANRPAVSRLVAPDQAPGDIKTSFIAAARRAAQAAQADVDAEMPVESERPQKSEPRRSALRAEDGRRAARSTASRPVPEAAGEGGIGSRFRNGLEKRRRTLILGLAAVVLALGAYQAYRLNFGEPAANPPIAASEPAPAANEDTATKAPVDPQTTQAIADAAIPPAPAPAKAAPKAEPPAQAEEERTAPTFPKVFDMATLTADLGDVPAGLGKLKEAALDGDGAAIYELAAREADGRGMPRDLAVAAKLYEKLAAANFAPAQFKLGSFYEKGSGVTRDVAQAKVWYGRAAERGNVRAMHNLAVLHAENPGPSGKPDFATASSWFRQAAEHGVRDSQYNLAVLYARGLGVAQDLIQSYVWFDAAAAQGDEEAGKKREDIATKLSAKDVTTAKSMAANFKPKAGDPTANDPPPPKAAAPAAMTLLGASPPGSANGKTGAQSRPGAKTMPAGV